MYIAVYPWSTQLYYKDLESIQVKIWKEFSQENNVEFINLFPLVIYGTVFILWIVWVNKFSYYARKPS